MMTEQKIERDEKYWNRFNELMDIRAERKLTGEETREYDNYLSVAWQLDRREAERCRPYVDKLMARHNEFLFSLDELTKMVENAAGDKK